MGGIAEVLFGELKIDDKFKFDPRSQYSCIKTNSQHPHHKSAGLARYDIKSLLNVGLQPIELHSREWIVFDDDLVYKE